MKLIKLSARQKALLKESDEPALQFHRDLDQMQRDLIRIAGDLIKMKGKFRSLVEQGLIGDESAESVLEAIRRAEEGLDDVSAELDVIF